MSYNLDAEEAKPKSWSHFEAWHVLFDAVCETHGYSETGKLAYQICRRTGKLGQKDVEAIARNIGNWRNGNHSPSRSNFRILSGVLRIDRDRQLLEIWNRLYRETKRPPANEERPSKRARSELSRKHDFGQRTWSYLGAAGGTLLTALLFGTYFLSQSGIVEEKIATEWYGNQIHWREWVSLRVGDQIVVHGYRGSCGGSPPSAEATKAKLPVLKTGKLVPGDPGLRQSSYCAGLTPAREVIFIAEAPGTEDFVIFGDDVTVTVME